MTTNEALIARLARIVGEGHVLTGATAAPYLTDWRGRFIGKALAVVRPEFPQQVADVVRLCVDHNIPIVPQGGNTGLCGGATPDQSGRAVILLTTRLNRVREIDTANDTMTVEAGCILQTVQERAQSVGRLFPLSLGAEGSCTIGGNLSTNAGGTGVLRYGNMRELTLGLEVVGADGQIWHGLRGLRKDNAGYDLRDLYVGSEGTLGIITAATIKLFPQPVARCTAMLALPGVDKAVALLSRARAGFGAALTGFELMAGACMRMVTRSYPHLRLPFEGPSADAPWFALLEISDSESEQHARERFEAVLGEAVECGEADDAVVAESITQSRALWHLRESITLAEAESGKSIKHDVSLAISRIAEFLAQTDAQLQERFPGIVNMTFGHLGDGNLHYNVGTSGRFTESDMVGHQAEIYALVHDAVSAMGGSISAEHGIGQLKVSELIRYKSDQEIKVMMLLKKALDPQCLLNPGKVLAAY
ncbi:FAD-binding oxidoreductase [Polaromonas sp.]|uniref:FAD-binding oxidoreductase n=1 Tax=Polaromonas sp. TaxID=1869339 RepID=UPI00286A20BD|nr:FAD-binding oxidoreductase [Polaromonas sp.]